MPLSGSLMCLSVGFVVAGCQPLTIDLCLFKSGLAFHDHDTIVLQGLAVATAWEGFV